VEDGPQAVGDDEVDDGKVAFLLHHKRHGVGHPGRGSPSMTIVSLVFQQLQWENVGIAEAASPSAPSVASFKECISW